MNYSNKKEEMKLGDNTKIKAVFFDMDGVRSVRALRREIAQP